MSALASQLGIGHPLGPWSDRSGEATGLSLADLRCEASRAILRALGAWTALPAVNCAGQTYGETGAAIGWDRPESGTPAQRVDAPGAVVSSGPDQAYPGFGSCLGVSAGRRVRRAGSVALGRADSAARCRSHPSQRTSGCRSARARASLGQMRRTDGDSSSHSRGRPRAGCECQPLNLRAMQELKREQ